MDYLWGVDLGGAKTEGEKRKFFHSPADARSHPRKQGIRRFRIIYVCCWKNCPGSGLSIPKKAGIGAPGMTDRETGLHKKQ